MYTKPKRNHSKKKKQSKIKFVGIWQSTVTALFCKIILCDYSTGCMIFIFLKKMYV